MRRILDLGLSLILILVACGLWIALAARGPESGRTIGFRAPADPEPAPAVQPDRTPIAARTPAGGAAREQVEPDGGGRARRVARGRSPRPAARALRLHGRVHRAGVPVPDYELSFHRAGAGPASGDVEWAWTDGTGDYCLVLDAGVWVVTHDDEGAWLEELRLPEGAADVLWDLELPGGSIHGIVRGEAGGRALDGARVSARRALPASLSSERTGAVAASLAAQGGAAWSDVHGAFSLADLRAGTYTLLVEHAGRRGAPRRVEVDGSSVAGIELCIESGARLVLDIVGPDGLPAAVDLVIVPGDGLTSLADLEAFPTHSVGYDGRLEIDGLPSGPACVFGMGMSEGFDLALAAHVDVTPAGRPIVLSALYCGGLEARVVRPDGRPVERAHLDLRSADGGLVLGSLEWLEDSPTTDESGRLTLDDLMPGRYRVAAGLGARLGPAQLVEVLPDGIAAIELLLD